MNKHEQKQQDKKERYKELAEKNREKSSSHHQSSRDSVSGIPLGQPILVGHHSEQRHRAAINRSDTQMRKAIETHNKADYYDRKAESVGKGGISSDDPDAIEKLKAKLDSCESDQLRMKAINKVIRKHAKKDNAMELVARDASISETQAALLLKPDFANRIGYPSYQTTNNAAKIRNIKKRIEELEVANERVYDETPSEFDGFRVRNNVTENRVQIEFDNKPEKWIRDTLKYNGFRWSPTLGVWQRHLNNVGISAATQLTITLLKGELTC